MATSHSDGSLTTTGSSTEDTIATITTSGSFVLGLDLNDMVLGDSIVVKVKLKVRSVGTTRLAYAATYKHVQSVPVVLTIPVASTNEIVFTVTQSAGTATIPWEIWEL